MKRRKQDWTLDASGSGYALTASTAFRIAMAHPKHAPAATVLVARYGMSLATAYRWRRAMLDAGWKP